MKIIKEGKLPEAYEFKGECGNCKTVVQFSASEAQRHSHRNETYYSVKCPTKGCMEDITVKDLPQNEPEKPPKECGLILSSNANIVRECARPV